MKDQDKNKEPSYLKYQDVKFRKKLCALLHGITFDFVAFYCLNCLHSFRTESKLKSREKVRKNKDFCGIVIPSEKNSIFEFNQYMKLDKIPYIIYANIESLIKKIDGCGNNSVNSSTTKIDEAVS